MSSKPDTSIIHRTLDLSTKKTHTKKNKKTTTALSEFAWNLKNQKLNTTYHMI